MSRSPDTFKHENHLVRPPSKAGPRGRGRGNDPTPLGLVVDWALGIGPEKRVIPSDTRFSQDFAKAPSVREHVGRALHDWRKRDGGVIQDGGRYENYRGVWDVPRVIADTRRFNAQTHVVGSYRLDGVRKGQSIEWTARNKRGGHSATYGRVTDKMPLLDLLPNRDLPYGRPMGSVRDEIHFETDLDGSPIRRPQIRR